MFRFLLNVFIVGLCIADWCVRANRLRDKYFTAAVRYVYQRERHAYLRDMTAYYRHRALAHRGWFAKSVFLEQARSFQFEMRNLSWENR